METKQQENQAEATSPSPETQEPSTTSNTQQEQSASSQEATAQQKPGMGSWFWVLIFGVSALAIFLMYNKIKNAKVRQKITPTQVKQRILENLRSSKALAAGKKGYQTSCGSCHGFEGGGISGPNLTDNYWIHGHKILDIYNVIYHGVPAKGMLTWGNILKPKEILEITAYVISIQGTKPKRSKPAQGKKSPPTLKKSIKPTLKK